MDNAKRTARIASGLLVVALIELLALLFGYGFASSMDDPYMGVRVLITALFWAAGLSVIGVIAAIACLSIDQQARGGTIYWALALHGLIVLPGLFLTFH
ncbi:hypothetical protein CFB50_25365 [Burkholderia sp. AU33423]|uniref:Uncharacterized protein n=1 Tax=Burkholderia contaminans TaxID=488447 RepID=A0A6P2VPA0_9BURK|nr:MULTISPECIES: hypothetical protein [Burkholderia]OXI81698.1 hypothetical protein CFB50_25365 [Burkholderia sp. AU33423]OXJ31007.1 hypothetical protein CFB82_26145 [Burkholderia sp. HI2714]VWC92808.1 hypothetical protein BCO71033_01238 [Burkholderia contaminans]